MYKTRCSVICAALIAVASASIRAADDRAADDRAASDRAAAAKKENELKLIAVLESQTAPKAEKAITCKQLAIFGSADAVPALKPLVADQELASWARIALEAIPGPAADEALRDALGSLEGRLAIGTINSIGVRRDARAVDSLAKRLEDKDPEVASAAAAALGKIGNAPATKVLRQSLAGASPAVRSAIAEGCILCAERLMAEDQAAEAVEIYDEVRQADVPKQRIVEATRGAILARKSDAIPLLVEQLRSKDKKMFQIGLRTARELSEGNVAGALLAELTHATPDRGALLLATLADCSGRTASPAVVKAAKSGPKQVRMAAIGVLQRSGDASCAPTLLEIATDEDAELAQTAITALAEFPNREVDATIAAQLPKAKGKMLVVLMEIVGQRQIAATPALINGLDDPDATVRRAALTALGETVELKDLDVLISRVTAAKHAEDASTAVNALRAACVRMPHSDACAAKLVGIMSGVPTETKCTILDVLGAMGGAKALQAIGAAGKDANPELQDAATRVLGGWMSVDAGPVLLDLAKNAPVEKYRIRAIRGYIRLVRQFNMPAEQRAEMCAKALETAQRTTEKRLVLQEVIGLDKYASPDMLRLAMEAGKVPALKDDATRIAMVIAGKIGGNSTEARKLLAQMGQDPVKVEIIKAEYGAGTKQKDVTETLRRYVRDLPLIALPSSRYNSSFGGDPVQGVPKHLKIQYRINGKSGEASFPEDAVIMLPMPGAG